MKTIIYIGGFELPDKNAAAQRVIGNAKALKELGFQVVLIDIDRKTNKKIEYTKKKCYGFDRFSMRYTNKRLYNIDDFLTVYNLYKNNELYVIAYNYPGIALFKIMKFCKRQNIKIYADSTEWYGMLGDNLLKKIVKGADSFIRMNVVQPKLDGIIVISHYMKHFYEKKLPTICIPPLTDITDIKWVSEEPEGHAGISLLYAGSPGKHKDKLNRIVEALAVIQDFNVKLNIVGITKDQFLEYYPEDKLIIKDLENNVIFWGRQPHDTVLHLLKQADFSIFYREITRVTMAGFPTKFSEAISCGTPVITNRTSDLSTYLIYGENGFWLGDDIVASLKTIFNYLIRRKMYFALRCTMYIKNRFDI